MTKDKTPPMLSINKPMIPSLSTPEQPTSPPALEHPILYSVPPYSVPPYPLHPTAPYPAPLPNTAAPLTSE
jgi:hypothetical protein